jgi:hypothetical protein
MDMSTHSKLTILSMHCTMSLTLAAAGETSHADLGYKENEIIIHRLLAENHEIESGNRRHNQQ